MVRFSCAALVTESAALDDWRLAGVDVPVHVDATSGSFIGAVFASDLVWDFRLPAWCRSTSRPQYGLTIPASGLSCGMVSFSAGDLVFRVNYLGGDMPTFTLNFSVGNQVVRPVPQLPAAGARRITKVMQALSHTRVTGGPRLRQVDHCGSDHRMVRRSRWLASGSPATAGTRVRRLPRAADLRRVPAHHARTAPPCGGASADVVREGLSADLARALHDDAVTRVLDRSSQVSHFDAQRISRTSAAASAPSDQEVILGS